MYMQLHSLYIFVFIPGICVSTEDSNNSTATKCKTRETCGECIAESSQCAWCSQENYTATAIPRCNTLDNLRDNCDAISHPKDSVRVTKDLNFSRKGTKEEDAIQVKPQEIYLRLKPNSPTTFQIQFHQAVDYPVDLYYLMDLSNSMLDDKNKLAELGRKVAIEMKKITTNFRLGFGSFVDKNVAPYVNPHPDRLRSPCSNTINGENVPCAAPYGFQNHMPLSLKTSEFEQKVRESRVSGNLDGREGGFDALMQVIVCKDEIVWRNKSRKLVVFTTDNGFHFAGDGKLGGIILPNDGNCHLDKDGFYTMLAEQDYPSMSQLNEKIKDHNVNVIFAVTKDKVPLYKKLNERLVGSTTGLLKTDSSNIVHLIRNEYNKITSSVKMTDNSKRSNYIQINYESSCVGNTKKKTSICNGLKVGDTVSFDVTVEVSYCPTNKNEWNQTFQIYPVGLNEFVTVHLEMICECECEKPWNEVIFSDKCSSGKGSYKCGICSCYANSFGKECECDARDVDPFNEEAGCFLGTEMKACSERGVCRCGKCYCLKRPNPEENYYGKFCQCDNFSCYKKNGKVCNGLDHGQCDCGKCKCHKDWSGLDCGCHKSKENCIPPNGELCSNHGYCHCGACVCNDTKKEYFGKYCDDCMSCVPKCEELRPCVECAVKDQGKSSNCSTCSFQPTAVEGNLEVDANAKEKQCTFEDDENCIFTFKYKITEENEYIVHYKSERDCPTPVNIVAIVSGVAGSIVGAGLLLLLLWKILTEIHDQREFVSYKKELQKAKWDSGENPIYKPSTSTFQNPGYGQE